MKPERLLRAILPDVLIDNFDIVNFDKSADLFDIYLDEKKVQIKEYIVDSKRIMRKSALKYSEGMSA